MRFNTACNRLIVCQILPKNGIRTHNELMFLTYCDACCLVSLLFEGAFIGKEQDERVRDVAQYWLSLFHSKHPKKANEKMRANMKVYYNLKRDVEVFDTI